MSGNRKKAIQVVETDDSGSDESELIVLKPTEGRKCPSETSRPSKPKKKLLVVESEDEEEQRRKTKGKGEAEEERPKSKKDKDISGGYDDRPKGDISSDFDSNSGTRSGSESEDEPDGELDHISRYLKNEYNIKVKPDELRKISKDKEKSKEGDRKSRGESKKKSGGNSSGGNKTKSKNKKKIEKKKPSEVAKLTDEEQCLYEIAKGKLNARRCPSRRAITSTNKKYCTKHYEMCKKKEADTNEEDEEFSKDMPAQISQENSLEVSSLKYNGVKYEEKELYMVHKKYLIQRCTNKSAYVICRLSHSEGNYLVSELTEMDKSVFKKFDHITFKDIDYLFNDVYEDEEDKPFTRERLV